MRTKRYYSNGVLVELERSNGAQQCWLELYEEERDRRMQVEQERDLLLRKINILTSQHESEIKALKANYERRIDGLIQFGVSLGKQRPDRYYQ